MTDTLRSDKFQIVQKILVQIAIIIFMVEMLVMKILPYISQDLSPFFEAVLDASFLTIFSTPFIYWFVIRPYIKDNASIVEKISHMAYHDPLTGLANRRLLTEYLDKELTYNLKSNKEYGTIMLIDLDGFKAVNDVHGHLAGDFLLVEVAKRLTSITRNSDLVSRIGGDEFVILVKEFDIDIKVTQDKSSIFAQKILDEILKPIIYKNETLNINASIGIRIFNSVQIGFESLLREADTAMYESKKSGKGKYTFFEEGKKY